MQQVLDSAVRDALSLAEGGTDAIFVENYGDTPFYPEQVPAETVAALTAIVLEIRRNVKIEVGINVLRNDAAAALGICAATGAGFVRVNVHTGAMLTDQGWIAGKAHETLRLRTGLGVQASILADVFVKHATPPAGLTIEDAALDTWERGHADALIVTGAGTGRPTGVDDVRRIRNAIPDAQILIGSGTTTDNARGLLEHADGAIVGSSLKEAGDVARPVDVDRVRRMAEVFAAAGR